MQPMMTGFVSAEDKANFDKQKDNYEESLANTKLSLSERLDLYVQYYTWIRRTTTSNLNGAKTILEVNSFSAMCFVSMGIDQHILLIRDAQKK
jgi:hypothetical protein